MNWLISALKFMEMAKKRSNKLILFVKIATNRAITSFLSGLNFFKMDKKKDVAAQFFLVSNSRKYSKLDHYCWCLSGHKLVKIARNPGKSSFLSGVRLLKISENREISWFPSGLKFLKIAKNWALFVILSGLKFLTIAKNRALHLVPFWSKIGENSFKSRKKAHSTLVLDSCIKYPKIKQLVDSFPISDS